MDKELRKQRMIGAYLVILRKIDGTDDKQEQFDLLVAAYIVRDAVDRGFYTPERPFWDEPEAEEWHEYRIPVMGELSLDWHELLETLIGYTTPQLENHRAGIV